jgi:hypothetical protein
MEKAIPIENLPPTFQDAVHITRRLGFNYLWIDSLCIIQDSPEDWNQESGQMAYIYSNSVLTVSAEAARDGSVGIFRSANMWRPKSSIKVNCHWNGHDLVDVWFRSLCEPEYGEFHLHQRAWALQETLLPPRVLTYTSQQLYYTCRTTQYDEQLPDLPSNSYNVTHFQYHNERCRLAKKILFRASSFDEQPVMGPGTVERGSLYSYPKAPDKDRTSQRPSKLSTGATDEELLQQWFQIVEAYTIRSLTFEKDRLPAIAGIAKVFGRLTDYSYKAGLWDEDLIRGLAWFIEPVTNRRARCSDYVAPSWTWASIPSRVSLNSRDYIGWPENFEAAEDTKVLETRLEYLSDDPYLGVSAGLLKIRGRCRSMEPEDYDYAASESHFDCHLDHSRTDDGVNWLLLLLGGDYVQQSALILEETDVHGTYKRVGLWSEARWEQEYFDWTINTLTII